jgi:LD-carboxypeptidase N-terminal domain
VPDSLKTSRLLGHCQRPPATDAQGDPELSDGAKTVAIVSTSSPVSRDDLDRLSRYFAERGYPVKVAAGAATATGYRAGPRKQRAADLMAAFADPAVRPMVPAAGGTGAAQLLDLLDFDIIRANPRVFTGTFTRPSSATPSPIGGRPVADDDGRP